MCIVFYGALKGPSIKNTNFFVKKTNFFLEKKIFWKKKHKHFLEEKNTNFFWKKNKLFLKKKDTNFFGKKQTFFEKKKLFLGQTRGRTRLQLIIVQDGRREYCCE
jgi:hypothetical protein